MADRIPIQNALLSMSDKTGLVDFARRLTELGTALYSTGGTRLALQQAGVEVHDVAEYTGWPEMMDGRVKTLHPKVHGGILYMRDDTAHVAAAQEHEIIPFDLVAVSLYPFERTVAREGVTDAEAIEQIDIGGPSMVRSAAKNHDWVAVVTDPEQYAEVLEELAAGGTSKDLRRRLAGAAFEKTARYDRAIADYFARGHQPLEAADTITLTAKRQASLRYGENPHQQAALYAFPDAGPNSLVGAEQLNGKELSYNNLLDLDAALALARTLPVPGVAVLKHNNPCGRRDG